jgi:hypothetical protein
MKKIGFGKKSFYVMSEEEIAQVKSDVNDIIDTYNDVATTQMDYILHLKEDEVLDTRLCCPNKLRVISDRAWQIKAVLPKES